ncbi:TIGR03643 family protein [Pedobacter westerhofensis]|uniref:TIGR03643 family protein n=1 Tax=Pedobacter westerhofensis TaxID=425512 RepID=A0A521BCD8_9SPHI|nr:TIGR03643 family protein [Pedobacter westerhofensis]SMO44756.1 TIGR03643 family protein [Pedobacter westerhofensis]
MNFVESNILVVGKGLVKPILSVRDTDRIIEMAWEDRTSFDAIKEQFGITEQQVIGLMRNEMKLSSFKLWRQRVQGRATKHKKLTDNTITRFKCSRQRQISLNKISKRS